MMFIYNKHCLYWYLNIEDFIEWQCLAGSNYWNGNGRCCQIPWTTDAYGYYYCPPGRRCDRRVCPPGQRCNRRSLEGFENNNHIISYNNLIKTFLLQFSIFVGVLIIGGQGSEKSVEAFNPWTRRHQCIPVCTVCNTETACHFDIGIFS